jgi:hypothetical protein
MGQLYRSQKSKYKNGGKVVSKFEMGGPMYKTIPEYEKARSIYEAEKSKAGTYNDFQTELYTQAGRTRGTSETPRQMGDMFNTLSREQQDAMAAKYKAEFVPSTTPSSTRRNYINSMEMNVPGKGTGYYSFPTNDVVYGTKVIERPMLQMDRIQVPQAKPIQQLSAGYKPSMNQRISMPGMKMPATQNTQTMAQPSKTYTSVVDLLNSRKMDSSFSARKKMAEKMGITNYTGTAAQNQSLMSSSMLGYGGSMPMFGPGGFLPKPTASDSLAVMNSQIALNKFYDNEVRKGKLKKTTVKDVFNFRDVENLNNDNLNFYRAEIKRREQKKKGVWDDEYKSNFNLNPSDVSKLEYQGLGKTKSGDANKQYYRDLITPLQNLAAPFALVDSRIKPERKSSYIPTGGGAISNYPGGGVSVYEYDPIAVKPAAMKTPADWAYMQKTYGTKPPAKVNSKPPVRQTINTTQGKVTGVVRPNQIKGSQLVMMMDPVKTKDNLEKLEIATRPLDNPKVTPRGELLPMPPKQTVNLTNLIQPGTHPIDIYDRRGNFLRQEFTGNSEGVPNHHYIGEHHYSPRGGNAFLDLNAPIKEIKKRANGGKLSSKYLKMLAYGGVITDDSILEEDQFERPIEPELNYMQVAQYALPKSVVNMKGEPITMPTGQTATINLDETNSPNSPNASSLETMGAIGSIGTQLGAALIGSKAQKKNNPNSTYTYDGQNRTTEGAKGIATGFALGNKIVPGVGGAVGAFAGGIYGIAKGSKMDKQAKLDRGYQDKMFKRSRDLEMEGRQRLQGEQQYGSNTQMYATGGSLSSKFLAGLNPAISQTSSSTTEINGKSHEDGGVPIRNMNAEVEKGETTSGDYVFSKRLGFAKIHKPIAKAKGMIEEKPMTASRINSLKLLAEKEQKLSMAQEYIKKTLNLQ